ncbi:Hypothetical predicted protein [Mytilus galloprovincialis]|uniref:B box-type domain-containing protein n=1 Tax=Mytilus galloprovincialis TaxID=29158 RepID=A0A8B6CRL6_MYTGA|nr:Hypothetical predicted protein [Mytilus galloprovincialis]
MACGGEQIPVSCGLCEEETKIKWKCVDCDMLLCDKCKEKIHVKFTKDHKVISIQELRFHYEEIDFSNLSCRNHTTQSCVMFCKICDCLVCPLCITETHNGHGLVPIGEGYDTSIGKFKTKQKKISTEIEELKKRKAKLKYIDKAEQFKYKHTTKKMEFQRSELKKDVDKHIDKLKSEISKRWRCLHQSLKKEESELTLLIRSMKSENSKVDEIIQSENAESVFWDGLESVHDIEETVMSCTVFDTVPTFLSGQITAINIGSLENIHSKGEIKSIKHFDTEISDVASMASCSEDVLWITNQAVVQKVRIEESSLKIIDQKDIEILGMACTQSKDLLLIAKESSIVKQISNQTGEITDSKYEVEDLEISAIHVNPDGKVTVGAYSGEISIPAVGRRVVIVMDRSGKHETTYQYDRQGKLLFTFILNITRTNNGNIFVVDTLLKDGRGRLVILSEDGEVLNTFSGLLETDSREMSDSDLESKSDSESESESESTSDSESESDSTSDSFKPANVFTTPSDNIILSNFDNGILFFLNNAGNLISWCDTNRVGIIHPYSFCTTGSGQIYIGCFTSGGSNDNAKIYAVDLL